MVKAALSYEDVSGHKYLIPTAIMTRLGRELWGELRCFRTREYLRFQPPAPAQPRSLEAKN